MSWNGEVGKLGVRTAIALGIAMGCAQTAVAAPGDFIGDPVVMGASREFSTFYTGPRMASDANGNFVAAWVDENGAIVARRYNKNGTALAAATEIAPPHAGGDPHVTGDGKVTDSVVAVNATGQYVVAWTDMDTGTITCIWQICRQVYPTTLHAKTFNADGTAASGDITVANMPKNAILEDTAAVAIDDDGDFVVSWMANTETPAFWTYSPVLYGSHQAVYARIFTAAGKVKTSTITVDRGSVVRGLFGTNGHSTTGTAVGMDGPGNVTVVWGADDSTATSTSQSDTISIHGRSYSLKGKATGTTFTVNASPISIYTSAPTVAMNHSGQFVVAWEGCNASVFGICARSYQPANVPASGEIAVGAVGSPVGSPVLSPVAIDAIGNFIVNDTAQSVRLFAANGAPRSASLLLPQVAQQQFSGSGVAMDPAGDAWVTYFGPPADASSNQILVQRIAGS